MKLSGWGKYPVVDAIAQTFDMPQQIIPFLEKTHPYIPFGMGRSYGDSALNHHVISLHRFNKILGYNPEKGVITCESGVTLSELIDILLPRGWFLPVVPGTRFVTVGGAIASDVHGKNHHQAGCFSEYVDSLDLMLANGEINTCSREQNSELFFATCGGMGLTGLILSATISLMPVESSFMKEEVICCKDLDDLLDCFEKKQHSTYSVAWIDCLAKKNRLGRAILKVGEHDRAGGFEVDAPASHSIPVGFNGYLLNKYSIKLFNTIYFEMHRRIIEEKAVSLYHFFFPLDGIDNWNRLYGTMGFTQYQLVLPKESGYEGLRVILETVSGSGFSASLAVLKLFGPKNSNYLSFPLHGYTLAMDFKITPDLFNFLERLDKIVLDYGGRLYLSKDARMPAGVFKKGYPEWVNIKELREANEHMKSFQSLQSNRLGL